MTIRGECDDISSSQSGFSGYYGFAKKHDVEQVILFGSRARGTHTERSDVDIAVRGGDFDGFYWDIKENVDSLLMFDVVNLDEYISPELAEELSKEGVVIYEKNG